MHDARYLISHYANQYVSVSQVGNSTQAQLYEKEPSMANVLTTGAWLSAPTRKPSFFARLLRSQIEARQRHADRLVEQYLAAMANVLTTGSAPTRKPSFFARLLRSQIEARQRHADRLVEQYLAVHGNKFTDDAERQIERLLFKAGP